MNFKYVSKYKVTMVVNHKIKPRFLYVKTTCPAQI